MITRDTMFAPLLTACPSFALAWLEFQDEWKDYPANLLPYSVLDDLAWRIAKRVEKGEGLEVDAVFRVVERWLVEGDADVIRAVEVGLLERFKHAKGPKNPVFRKAIRDRLGPVSRRAWNAGDGSCRPK